MKLPRELKQKMHLKLIWSIAIIPFEWTFMHTDIDMDICTVSVVMGTHLANAILQFNLFNIFPITLSIQINDDTHWFLYSLSFMLNGKRAFIHSIQKKTINKSCRAMNIRLQSALWPWIVLTTLFFFSLIFIFHFINREKELCCVLISY